MHVACNHPASIKRQEEEGEGGLAVVLFLSDTPHDRVSHVCADVYPPALVAVHPGVGAKTTISGTANGLRMPA